MYSGMKQTKLKFHSLMELWAFKMLINLSNVEINVADCILICACSDEQIQIAIESFRAEIVEQMSFTQ